MSLFAVLTGLFGCGEPKTQQHSISEVTSVSIACGHMDRSYCYSFWLRKEGEQWLFDTECAIRDHSEPIALENLPVDSGAVNEVLAILEQSGAILYAENYKQPKKSELQLMDATTYGFSLMFSDGSQYSTSDLGPAGDALEDYFYALSEQKAQQD